MDRLIFSIAFLMMTAGSFAQDLKPVEKNGKFGFSRNQELVILPAFDYACSFTDGLALVKTNGKWGFIDSLGNWKIKADFDKAQPFVNGTSYVEKNNMIGLISTDGTYLIEANYSNIVENYEGFYTIGDNSKKGFLAKDSQIEIPAKYLEIEKLYDIVSGKNEDGSWDIYYKGKLQLSHTAFSAEYGNCDFDGESIIISSGGKYGMYKFNQGWIVPQEFAWIEKLEFMDYELPGYTYKQNHILALHQFDFRDFNPETWDFNLGDPVDSISLVKLDGTKISALKFNEITKRHDRYFDLGAPERIELALNGNLYKLNFDFSLEKLKYSNIEPFLVNWYIAGANDFQYILNHNSMVLDSFPRVSKYKEYGQVSESYNDYGEFDYDYQDVYEPFLIVSRYENETQFQAIYNLEEEKIISPWMNVDQLIVNRYPIGDHILYTYGNSEAVGFYTRGMDKGTDLNYSSQNYFTVLGHIFYVQKTVGDRLVNEVYRYDDGDVSLTKILETGNRIFLSDEFRDNEWVIDEETGEEYLKDNNRFSTTFFVLEDEHQKYGLISQTGKVILPKYDELNKNDENELMISITKDQKFGNIDLYSGEVIEPVSKEPLKIELTQLGELDFFLYTTVHTDSASYYVDVKGKKFQCLMESVYPKKAGKRYFIEGYSSLAGHDQEELAQTADFRMLEMTEKINLFKAQGNNKKWGYINFIGDTVIPFKYTKIQSAYMEIAGSENLVLTSIKKKKGVADLTRGEVIPCEFDRISQFVSGDYYLNAFLVEKNKKFGVYAPNGEVILPCIYENKFDIYYTENEFDSYFISAEIKGKRQVQFYNNTYFDARIKVEKLRSYDYTVNDKGYIKNGAVFEIYDLKTGRKENIQSAENMNMSGNSYDIKLMNGKFGAVDKSGIELIPCIYDSATFFDGRDEVMIGYEKGVKYYIYVFTKERYTEQEW